MTVGERIKQRRKQIGMSAEDLAERVGKSASTIYRYENGDISGVDSDILYRIASVLNARPEYLLGYEEYIDPQEFNFFRAGMPSNIIPASYISTRRVPILGDTAAGQPIIANREYDEYVEVPDDGHHYDAALRVKGDSMKPKYNIDDLVFIRYQDDVHDGQVAAVCLDDEVTLKRIYHIPHGIQLISDNPEYPPMVYMDDDVGCAHLVGLAVGVLHWDY